MSQPLHATARPITDDDPDFDEDIPTSTPPQRCHPDNESTARPGALTNGQPHHGDHVSAGRAGSNTCHATGCGIACTGFMCEPHFKLVPPAMRMVIESSPDLDAVPPAIAKAAIAEVAHREARSKPKTRQNQTPPAAGDTAPKPAATETRPKPASRKSRAKPSGDKPLRRNPVQLALFGDDQVLTKGKRR
ncbi:hypothetical protein [Mycolicibacterium sphagni]|uniref:Uncharacterized protein n=1 Tax=Mycolicibacterium sphagni TaxID=1786 RepID=A0ABX2K4C0_9MYCO|nr:hypothetical protein [Mycolicibacterium sphagni]NTY62582.1 hypothetical protein [Mycolicibacterium sphagni]